MHRPLLSIFSMYNFFVLSSEVYLRSTATEASSPSMLVQKFKVAENETRERKVREKEIMREEKQERKRNKSGT